MTSGPGPVLDDDPATRHPLHDPAGAWSETNCYTDLWVQLLHRLGLDPVPAMAFVLGTRFEGEQWTFAKPPVEDLYRLYGIRVVELYVWRPLAEHVRSAAERGDLLTIEVDAHFLPDTAATVYRRGHEKTTIVPVRLEPVTGELRYLHNGGCFDLAGDDFAGLFPPEPDGTGLPLPPYTELVALGELRAGPPDPELVRALVATHLARRPAGNPVADLGERLRHDLPRLARGGVDEFHLYAFATVRQCGAVASLGAAVAERLAAYDGDVGAVDRLRTVADRAKTVQFLLARAARGRAVDLGGPLEEMAGAWAAAVDALARRYAG